MPVTLDWLGCATYRLTIDDLVVFCDGYMDRVPSAPDVGMTTADVDRADYVLVGHSHFDHIAGVETIASNTGARVIASNESVRVLRDAGVDSQQLMPSQGGERHELAPGITVRVIPSLHSCIWEGGSWDPNEVVIGHYGLSEHEKQEVRDRSGGRSNRRGSEIGNQASKPDAMTVQQMEEHQASTIGSNVDGGVLAYLFETPYGSIFWQDTSGCWTRLLSDLRPDFAIVAMAGRANIDGDPIQGSLAQYVARVTDLLRPSRLTLGHHDNWMPPLTRDLTSEDALSAVRSEISKVSPSSELVQLPYLSGFTVFE
ncbi:MAG: hypothetical protein CL790_06760 [Chloroflexi bacterium]|nr:hypothetical protein [Chloroflexota bacterium]